MNDKTKKKFTLPPGLPKGSEWYRCCKCKFEWPDFPGVKECQMCQHKYVEWVSYEEDRFVTEK